MKSVAGSLKLDLAQYREKAAFSQFASDLDQVTRNMLERGARLVEILKQGQYVPLPFEKQVIIIYAANNGFLDAVPVERVRDYERDLYAFLDSRRAQLLSSLAEKKQIDDAIKGELSQALTEFGKTFDATQKTAV